MRAMLRQAASLMETAAALHREGRLGEAEAAYRRVLLLDATNAAAMNMLGLIHANRGDSETAVRLMRVSLRLSPSAPFAYNLGLVLEARGDVDGAIAAYRCATELDPCDVTNWTSAIFAGDLHPRATPSTRLTVRRAFDQRHCAALTAAAAPHMNDPDPDRPLRVGYLSADFVDHSARLVFESIICGHDRTNVDVFLYWQQRQPSDRVTARFARSVEPGRFVTVNRMTDEQLAQQMRDDGIDILVDLAGYSNGNRLTALARKPAPIIMTGWGHVTGLGIDACDYLLADAITVPEEDEHHYHERVLRLPCVLALDPGDAYPDVTPAPAATREEVTFGYFGRATKTNDAVWATWARILAAVPASRLAFKGREYADAGYRARILGGFTSRGVDGSRIEFLGATDRNGHLSAYGTIDVALDTWPQTGGVTTLEACLMGVPSVTLYGDHLNGRIGASILATIGRGQLVATDTDAYVEIAVRLARTRISLESRRAIRANLLGSIICNPREYALAAESLYRQAWHTWLDAQAPIAGERTLHLVSA